MGIIQRNVKGVDMEKQIEEMARDICIYSDQYETCKICDTDLDIGDDTCIYKIMAKSFIEQGYTKQEWISVEERLPVNDYEKHWKDRNYYLVYTQPCGIMFVATYGYKNNDWWCDMNDFVLDEKNWSTVTHYMPLPQKPKMKGADSEK